MLLRSSRPCAPWRKKDLEHRSEVERSFMVFLLAGSPPFHRKVSSFGGLLGWAEKDCKFG